MRNAAFIGVSSLLYAVPPVSGATITISNVELIASDAVVDSVIYALGSSMFSPYDKRIHKQILHNSLCSHLVYQTAGLVS